MPRFEAYRWCDSENGFTKKLRGGTWYGCSFAGISRYKANGQQEIGGRTPLGGFVEAANPFYTPVVPENYVLHDLGHMLPFGDDLARIRSCEEPRELIDEFCRENQTAAHILRKKNDWTVATSLSDHVAARWLTSNGYDLLVLRLGHDEGMHEVFDFCGLFRPDMTFCPSDEDDVGLRF